MLGWSDAPCADVPAGPDFYAGTDGVRFGTDRDSDPHTHVAPIPSGASVPDPRANAIRDGQRRMV